MTFSRRKLLTGAATLAATSAAAGKPPAATVDPRAPAGKPEPAGRSGHPGHARVKTLNGRSLEWRLVDGVKEFHLTAGEFDHEFATGCRARCWGYNGSTPGPTIEAVEGDRLRIFLTNELAEPTTIHWHGILLPNGMDGVGGLTQPYIQPGETWVYEFTLRQHGTYLYHPHADEMTQVAFGMMGLFIIHPREPVDPPVDRDFAFILHNWALHPGTFRPDPSVMTEFDLWTFNSKVSPAIETLIVGQNERVRIRVANMSMHNHPIHLHGHRFWVTGSDGGRWPRALWRPEVTEVVGVGQTRDLEFVADNPGDWTLHCHMSHHTMNAMGHGIANPVGVRQGALEARVAALLPGFMAMGEAGMHAHTEHLGKETMPGPENTLPMAMGEGPFGPIGMGGMFTLLKVRSGQQGDTDPGWYVGEHLSRARRVKVAAVSPPGSPTLPPTDAAPEPPHHHHD